METRTTKTKYVNLDSLINTIIDSSASLNGLMAEAIHSWYFENAEEDPETFIRGWMRENGNPVNDEEEFMPYVRLLYALEELEMIEVTTTTTVEKVE